MIRSQVGETKKHSGPQPKQDGPVAILIPARMSASRLPGKPLAMIGDVPMIVQVWRRAQEAQLGKVFVACAEAEIAAAVEAAGGEAVLTDPELPSGTDRIKQALDRVDSAGKFQTVINLQGDFPTLDPRHLACSLQPLTSLGADIGTLVNRMDDPSEWRDPAKVKAIVSWHGETLGKALYFTRAQAPSGDGPLWHHCGIYAFRRDALSRFTELPPSPLELREKLEQLRALEHGMVIGVSRIDAAPFGVDTPADLDRARTLLA